MRSHSWTGVLAWPWPIPVGVPDACGCSGCPLAWPAHWPGWWDRPWLSATARFTQVLLSWNTNLCMEASTNFLNKGKQRETYSVSLMKSIRNCLVMPRFSYLLLLCLSCHWKTCSKRCKTMGALHYFAHALKCSSFVFLFLSLMFPWEVPEAWWCEASRKQWEQ